MVQYRMCQFQEGSQFGGSYGRSISCYHLTHLEDWSLFGKRNEIWLFGIFKKGGPKFLPILLRKSLVLHEQSKRMTNKKKKQRYLHKHRYRNKKYTCLHLRKQSKTWQPKRNLRVVTPNHPDLFGSKKRSSIDESRIEAFASWLIVEFFFADCDLVRWCILCSVIPYREFAAVTRRARIRLKNDRARK